MMGLRESQTEKRIPDRIGLKFSDNFFVLIKEVITTTKRHPCIIRGIGRSTVRFIVPGTYKKNFLSDCDELIGELDRFFHRGYFGF